MEINQAVHRRGSLIVEPVYNSHPWDHAEWLLYRDDLLIEVGGALGFYHSVGDGQP